MEIFHCDFYITVYTSTKLFNNYLCPNVLFSDFMELVRRCTCLKMTLYSVVLINKQQTYTSKKSVRERLKFYD